MRFLSVIGAMLIIVTAIVLVDVVVISLLHLFVYLNNLMFGQ